MKILILMLILVGCQNNVPEKVKHEVSGNATTTNIIRIEISIPPETLDAFKNTCKNQCVSDLDPVQCEVNCNAQHQTDYTNAILALISQFQNIAKPPTITN